jgi:metal-responsive CopG/Arc/MetJ family transcriptional regulator
MATDKPRILITVDEKLLENIDDYRYANRIPSRSKAIRKLIREALKKQKKGKS